MNWSLWPRVCRGTFGHNVLPVLVVCCQTPVHRGDCRERLRYNVEERHCHKVKETYLWQQQGWVKVKVSTHIFKYYHITITKGEPHPLRSCKSYMNFTVRMNHKFCRTLPHICRLHIVVAKMGVPCNHKTTNYVAHLLAVSGTWSAHQYIYFCVQSLNLWHLLPTLSLIPRILANLFVRKCFWEDCHFTRVWPPHHSMETQLGMAFLGSFDDQNPIQVNLSTLPSLDVLRCIID